MTKVRAIVDHDIIREKKGLELLEENVIKCADCGRKLLEVIIVKESDNIKNIMAECPFCDGESFKHIIKGESFFQAYKTVSIDDIETDIVDDIIFMNIKVIKNG